MANSKKAALLEVARTLYLSGKSQKDIARQLELSEQTVSRWAKKNNWDALKVSLLMSRQQRLAELYNELREFNDLIKSKEGPKIANSKEADIRRKLIRDIKELESDLSISEIVNIGIEFAGFAKSLDAQLAERITSLYDLFITHKIEENKWQN